MEGHILLHSLKLQNILSYGNEGIDIELQPLNVLVGPNGSGKSNLIEALRLLHASTSDITQPIVHGGGINEWLWKGEFREYQRPNALIQSTLNDIYDIFNEDFLLHNINFNINSNRMHIMSEEISDVREDGRAVTMYGNINRIIHINTYGYISDDATGEKVSKWTNVQLDAAKLKSDQSILAQRNDPDAYPSLASLQYAYQEFRFYTDAPFGRGSAPRQPQSADADASFLAEDYSNLALVLNEMQLNVGAFRRLLENLKLFYERVENIVPRVSYGTVQLYFQERGLQQLVPATRLSDGTLRYLCLLAILCHPSPPSLICIEEPELGMHPDILPTLAKLLIEASQRTQLIITTHSDILLSAFSDIPEAVIVCEHDNNGTSLKRLNKEDLQIWLKDFALGEAWLKGAFGGTRW